MRGATVEEKRDNVTGVISIHAPHAGRDEGHLDPAQLEEIFQSTHPSRGATWDLKSRSTATVFQSTRPVRGATCVLAKALPALVEFQSTRPMRGATQDRDKTQTEIAISIHAPHAGRDGVGL